MHGQVRFSIPQHWEPWLAEESPRSRQRVGSLIREAKYDEFPTLDEALLSADPVEPLGCGFYIEFLLKIDKVQSLTYVDRVPGRCIIYGCWQIYRTISGCWTRSAHTKIKSSYVDV